MKIIDRKKFAKVELDKHIETFVMHVTSLARMMIYLANKAQIASLVTKKLKIPSKYSDFKTIFSKEKILLLPETTNLNQYAIMLEKGQQPLYEPIYSLNIVELKTLKSDIKTNLANGLIWSLKLSANSSILFVRKLDGNFCLCVNY